MWKALFLCLAAATAASAQEPSPDIGYVYPAGGQVGTTFQVLVAGQHLAGASTARITGSGVQAKVLEYLRPLNQGAFKIVQKQMQDLLAQKRENPNTWTEAQERRAAELRERMTTFYVRQSSVPALVETVALAVTVSPDAAPGRRELRIQTAEGLSNPLQFVVGQLREYTEPSNRSTAVADSRSGVRRRRPPEGTEKPPPGTVPATGTPDAVEAIALPATLNGQILPRGVDRYRFQAREGQQIVAEVSARSLIPYLSDAVPGWFQAVASLFDADGREVAYEDDFLFHPDPVLHCAIPRDGEYVLEIRDALYRGREDFVYRVAIGELPYVTSIFPLGSPAGTRATIELTGWNLPAKSLTLAAKSRGVDSVCARSGDLFSNRLPFAVDTLPEVPEAEPNDEQAKAQRVRPPLIVNGRIGRPGDRDAFCFVGRAGQQLVAEVKARRLGSPLDSVLKLTDATGRQIALDDDFEDKGAGLTTHHADSRISATLSSNGLHYLYLMDGQRQGGPNYSYRLLLCAPNPDFELRVVPSAINARAGTTVPVTMHVLRRDGFAGAVDVELRDAPVGLRLSGGRVGSSQETARMTLTVSGDAPATPIRLNMIGRAKIHQNEVVRTAVPADDLMQAFAYRHLVPAEELVLCVLHPAELFAVGPPGLEPLRIPAGGQARLPVSIPAGTSWGEVRLALSEPPPGITIADAVLGRPDGGVVFNCDAQVATPGTQGNLIVNVYAYRDPEAMKGREQRKKPLRLLTALPAIPFEIAD